MRGFYPKHQADIEHILKKAPLSNDVFLSIMDEMHTAYSLAEITERELKRNREQYSIHYKRKASEYEAKAKAFDEIREARKEILVDVHERGFNIPADQDKFTLQSENIINKYESGESND